jgi:DHA1 family inner membrane transport protein
MNETTNTEKKTAFAAVSAVLFTALFAAQAGVIAMSPILVHVARDLEVSTAAAGQLRMITGLSAGVTALLLGRIAQVLSLRRQLLAASILLALGSLMSAAAPTYVLLALAQVPVGVAVATLVTAGTVAAGEWVSPEQRTRALSWALVGQPTAWIIGMPLVGFVGDRSWRYAWLALPLTASLAAAVALLAIRPGASRPAARTVPLRVALRDRTVARWLAAELLANMAWAGTLVYSGALFVESYGASSASAGIVLAIGAGAYIVGNRIARRLDRDRSRAALVLLSLSLGVTTASLGLLRWSLVVSALLFSAAALAAGARTMISSAFGLSTPPELRPALMGARAATMQFGYFGGSITGGIALTVAGYAAFGFAIGVLFLGAAATLASRPRFRGTRGSRSRIDSLGQELPA